MTRSRPISATDPSLRSQTPDGVRQEIYAHLIVHHATRDLLDEASRIAQCPAERTSFTGPCT
ncbi:hypothetical protein [Streptomyces sanglieri]|uniref:hypothetical protein n=1 Tax=Streptomyces sanglieri TaxID=193460 RepID=UPI0035265C7C